MKWLTIPELFKNRSTDQRKSSVAARAAPSYEVGAYCEIDAEKELRQGEIITNVTHYVIEPDPSTPGNVITSAGVVRFSVIATPECDLLQDYKATCAGKTTQIREILFFEMEEPAVVKKRISWSTKEWSHVMNNEVERFYFLGEIAADRDALRQGLPGLIVDFKRYFTLPPKEIYRQCSQDEPGRACRRCRLSELWREDLQRRAMSYMQRVGLPDARDAVSAFALG
jgi:hypothetical protein